jgi:predicted Rossmann fold flavoprotein
LLFIYSQMRIAIIGAGAAGCFAAANIPYRVGLEVAVFEKTGKALQKVKASGGGRCNVTHDCFDVPELLACYPRGKQLLRKTLYEFGPRQTIDWFEQRGVQLKSEPDGRIFPISDSSQTIIDCIWNEMMNNKAQVFYHKQVTKIAQQIAQPGMNHYSVHFSDATIYEADAVLVATGGFPKAEQYKWIGALGHTIQPPVPSLFTFNMPKHPVTELMGISVPDAILKIAGTKIVQHGPLLITHWGMSGPAVLKTSAIAARELADCNYQFQVVINWLGDFTDVDMKETLLQLRRDQGKNFLQNKNPFNLPKRLWEYQLKQCGIENDIRWGDLPAAAQNKLVAHLLRDIYEVKGKTTFKEEFVTCGGVTLSEIDPQTLESRIAPGIYFAGEILDADGITGGYNFQHAWSSGWIAAKSQKLKMEGNV